MHCQRVNFTCNPKKPRSNIKDELKPVVQLYIGIDIPKDADSVLFKILQST